MPGIVIQATFDVMQGAPIDSRLVANNANERLNINYLYAGLKVYQKDINRTYTFDGSTWYVEGSGIYGGSGSLLGDTTINLGTVSNTSTSRSIELSYQADTTGTTKAYLYNYFYRHTNSTPTLEWKDIEFRHQYKYLDNSGALKNSAYISLNPLNPISAQPGAISFNTGFDTNLSEKMRISWNGKVGIGTNDPKEFLQIGTVSGNQKPFVLHNSGSAVIGYNWYFDSVDQVFDATEGSSKIAQDNGSLTFQVRGANTNPTGFTTSIFINPTASVGIRTTTPSVELDVNGSINSNRNIRGDGTVSGGTVSSDNISLAKRFELKYASNNQRHETYIASSQSKPYSLTVQNKEVSYSTLVSNFFHNVNISSSNAAEGNLTVQRNIVSTNGNLTVQSPGFILNFEPSVSINLAAIYLLNNYAWVNINSPSPILNIGDLSLTTSAYRVGALVHLTIEFSFPSGSTYINQGFDFKGYVLRFETNVNTNKFIPSSHSFALGTGGKNPTSYPLFPMNIEVFQNDPTNGNIPPPPASNLFYVRFRAMQSFSPNDYGVNQNNATILPGAQYRGTIIYKGI